MNFEIWDVHTHLSGVPGDAPEACLGRLIEFADRLGIARLCVMMGMKPNYDPSPENMRQQNDEVLRAIKRFPDRALGFVYLNPRHTQASLDELNRCVRDGPMVGVKLWVALRCNDSSLDPLVARATELKAPVVQHTWLKITGNLPGESTPMDLAELATRHPNATLICAHTGGDWERGIRVIRPHAHIFADINGGDPTAGFTEMAVRELGAERVLYGSDAGGRSFASQLAKVLGADIPDAAKRLIFVGNTKRILQPILRAKGIKL
ncbi:MAG: amidohydrolase family protein [Verrucomicrobiae bacterium]|nr:amidohydrolase family protein [Verrucomicrobiae bacterium]